MVASKTYLLDPERNWKIEEPHFEKTEVLGVICPQCGKRGCRRMGVHFDHEWRCGHCNLSWEPDRKYLIVQMTKE